MQDSNPNSKLLILLPRMLLSLEMLNLDKKLQFGTEPLLLAPKKLVLEITV